MHEDLRLYLFEFIGRFMDRFSFEDYIKRVLSEDIGDGDHTSLATIPPDKIGKAKLLVKENGIIAGIDVAKKIVEFYDSELQLDIHYNDGDAVKKGDKVFFIEGKAQSILSLERTILNIMQRMSAIATKTRRITDIISHTQCRLLDTRKTTPLFRYFEKEAVKIGGGVNHRFGLYDMVMIKDNHVDYAGGITQAIHKTNGYLKKHKKDLKIEIEVRNLDELNEVLAVGNVHRIMLDNFNVTTLEKAVSLIGGRFETEASGGITEDNILEYALTGVDFISVGALTHSVKSLDLSLKAM